MPAGRGRHRAALDRYRLSRREKRPVAGNRAGRGVESSVEPQPMTPSSHRMMMMSRIVPTIPSPNMLTSSSMRVSARRYAKRMPAAEWPSVATPRRRDLKFDRAGAHYRAKWPVRAPCHAQRQCSIGPSSGYARVGAQISRGEADIDPRNAIQRARTVAGPTGFEPAISSVTGWHVGPLHHGPAAVTVAEHSTGTRGLQAGLLERSRCTSETPAAP